MIDVITRDLSRIPNSVKLSDDAPSETATLFNFVTPNFSSQLSQFQASSVPLLVFIRVHPWLNVFKYIAPFSPLRSPFSLLKPLLA